MLAMGYLLQPASLVMLELSRLQALQRVQVALWAHGHQQLARLRAQTVKLANGHQPQGPH